MKYLNYLTAVLLALVISAQVNANCVRVNPVDQGCDACGASLNLGNIGLMNVNYQPVGTVLARSVFRLVPAIRNSDPERVLYQCDLADKDSIYEVFATNGDSNVGGAWDMGDYHFQTYFPFTALKLVHMRSGKPFTRIWQQVPLTEYEVSGNKILIKGKHFSPISAELIRTGTNERKAAYASWGVQLLLQITTRGLTTVISLTDMWSSRDLEWMFLKQAKTVITILTHGLLDVIWLSV